jgi:hypothetical protein
LDGYSTIDHDDGHQADATLPPGAIALKHSGSLKICWPIQEGDARPSEVGAKEGSNTRLLTLKREAKDK